MKTADIRQAFIDYFNEHDHTHVPSSSLIPGNDPTLLFTNAGMVQFKETFLGLEKRAYTRAVSSQRCVRAGGKHNDLENVGYTARHHTFFEMLGNFSFGDYFKREAIQYAWEFLTKRLNLPPEKLWVTVHDSDDEAASIWLDELKVSADRFSRCGDKDNFWSMGETGPCGPCSEIFYDHGPEVAGGPPGSPEQEGDRYVEIWNLVFMQYDRAPGGAVTPLPSPSVDTGMGLERIAAVMQGVHSNYDIDLFKTLIKATQEVTGCRDDRHVSLRVIADHIRSCSFLISDGVTPSNEGRGYVLRRIIRRAVRHGYHLGQTTPFFHKLVPTLVAVMGDYYKELVEGESRIMATLEREEAQFAKTLEHGLALLEEDITKIGSAGVIPGDTLFKLYDTYGFPLDLTADIARERGLTLDVPGFEAAMAKQRKRSGAASEFRARATLATDAETAFTGYASLSDESEVLALFDADGQAVDELVTAHEGTVVLAATPFYAESGGQVGDTGALSFEGGTFQVSDTLKQGKTVLHHGTVSEGTLRVSARVMAQVDRERRTSTMLNHSATHLLHAALRHLLGEHVVQKGSLVAPDRLRFDFTHSQPLTQEEIEAVEQLVNRHIRLNHQALIQVMKPADAEKSGALALFGEKYGDEVRVLSYGDFSKELCGGTHVEHTGEIGLFVIVSESGIASGVRRIEALTGEGALLYQQRLVRERQAIANTLKTNTDNIDSKLKQLMKSEREQQKAVEQLQAKLAQGGGEAATPVTQVNDVNVIAKDYPAIDVKVLRETLDNLKDKHDPAVVVLAARHEDSVQVVAGVSKSCVGRVPKAGDLVKAVCGRGGGRPDMAQGGGPLPEDLSERLSAIPELVKTFMAS